jgi:hypothetical protein
MTQGIFTMAQQLQGQIRKVWSSVNPTYSGSYTGNGSAVYTNSTFSLSGNFTIEGWIHGFNSSTGLRHAGIGQDNSGTGFAIYSAGFYANGLLISWSPTYNQWQHWALVRNGTTITLYLNGVSQGTTTASTTYSGSFYVGANNYNGTIYADCPQYLSNVRFTNTAVYTSNFTPSTTPLTAISGTQVLTLNSQNIVDNSGNNYALVAGINSDIFNPFSVLVSTPAVEYLVVAGGGGGGGGSTGGGVGGGGGAGGLLQGIVPITAGIPLTVTVGGGGSAGSMPGVHGSNGCNSVFGNVTAIGGGGGGGYGSCYGCTNGPKNGGSGGGAGQSANAQTHSLGVPGQGNSGAQYYVPRPNGGAGGGGAGNPGLPNNGCYGGYGGYGIASAISGTLTGYAGGGGGSSQGSTANAVNNGGFGGGGWGRNCSPVATAGGTNTGGGGGGGGGPSGGSGAGGAGIVIISYPDIYNALTSFGGANSPTVSTSGSGSVSLNGSSQYLNYGTSSAFAFGTGDFTFESWVYLISYPGSGVRGIFDTGGAVDSGRFGFAVYPSGYVSVDNNTNLLQSGSNLLPLNQWVHVAVSRSSGTMKIFFNGAQVASGSVTNNFTDTSSNVGITTDGYKWYGYISNLRVVKGTAVYTSAFTPSTTPLTAITNTQLLMNAVSGAYLSDGSTNSFTPIATGSPTWNQLSPFATGLGYKNRVYTWTGSGTVTF